MIRLLLSLLIMNLVGLACCQAQISRDKDLNSFDHAHTLWNKVLKEYVVTEDSARSAVQYSLLKATPDDLNTYIMNLQKVTLAELSAFSAPKKLAFLINAYNALTLKLIIDHLPLRSIRDLDNGAVWDTKFFAILQEKYSLNDIEHQMLRKDFNEPRIHFVLVCAARGCPPLRNEAYVADRLEIQLEDATKKFLNDPTRNRYDPITDRFLLSKIFDWYKDDFKNSGGVSLFVQKYMSSKATSASKVEYLEYDWGLNDVLWR